MSNMRKCDQRSKNDPKYGLCLKCKKIYKWKEKRIESFINPQRYYQNNMSRKNKEFSKNTRIAITSLFQYF